MKRFAALCLTLLFLAGLTACGAKPDTGQEPEEVPCFVRENPELVPKYISMIPIKRHDLRHVAGPCADPARLPVQALVPDG